MNVNKLAVSNSKRFVKMSCIKHSLVFAAGWFLCGLFNGFFSTKNDYASSIRGIRVEPLSNYTIGCDKKNMQLADNISTSMRPTNTSLANVHELEEVPRLIPQNSRCSFGWDSTRCTRPPMRPFDISSVANTSCFAYLNGSPAPVIVIAALPRSGGSVLTSAIEYATGIRVGQAFEAECNAKQYSFIETTYPFRRKVVPPGCSFWLSKYVRSKPRVARVWGVVVVIRNPYRWLGDMFGGDSEKTPVVNSFVLVPLFTCQSLLI